MTGHHKDARQSSGAKTRGLDLSHVRAPLVIGITGHRDIRDQDREVLKDKVKEILLELKSRYTATPLLLLSALAEGADRLAAWAALDPEVGIRLVVPLPMPKELYEEDFDELEVLETPLGTVAISRSSRGEFRTLLEKADARCELPLADGNDYESIVRQGPERDRQYEMVGKYIAQHSQILIALWDGVDSNLVGGTASVVRFQIEGLPAPGPCALEPREGFPVYHVLTPRAKDPYPQGEVFGLRKIYPKVFGGNDAAAEKYYGTTFARLDEFNGYIARPDPSLMSGIAKSKAYLLQDIQEHELPAALGPELNRYATADALAIRFQQQMISAHKFLHWVVFLSFASFVLFAHWPENWLGGRHPVIFLILGLLGALFLVVWAQTQLGKPKDLGTKHQDYRAIAEGLRVKFFWRLAGLAGSVAEHYLGKQRSELDWIRNGLRGWNVAGHNSDPALNAMPASEQADRLRFVRKYWMDDQKTYFHKAAERDLKKMEKNEYLKNICIVAVLALAILILMLPALKPIFLIPEDSVDLLIILLDTSLAAGALLHHFNDRMAYSEHAKQYSRMAALFSQASDLIGEHLQAGDYKAAQICVEKVGKEALAENGDWVLLHRERPLEVPHP